MNRRTLLAASTGLAVLVPAAAQAHPGVYTVTQVTRPAGQTCTFPDESCLSTATQYAIANDGYAIGLTETGTTGIPSDSGAPGARTGILNYKKMPSGWRTTMSVADKLNYDEAQTDVQAHATCTGSGVLGQDEILAWQPSHGVGPADPFFNYIPWQRTSAGIGDEPEKWIPVVKAATGVDLAALTTPAAAQKACETLGGTYRAADTIASITNALVADVKAPLQAQIDLLTGRAADLQTQLNTRTAEKVAAESAKVVAEQALAAARDAGPPARRLEVKLSAKSVKGGTVPVMVTGPANVSATIRLVVSSATAKRIGASSRTLVKATRPLGAAGATLVALRPPAAALKRGAVPFTVRVQVGATLVSASGKVSR